MKKPCSPGLTNKYITCPYCQTRFENNGRPQLQVCPKCHSKLLL